MHVVTGVKCNAMLHTGFQTCSYEGQPIRSLDGQRLSMDINMDYFEL